ncbi:hypothetical protein U0035_02265 [Niabella yanshanensis]|uniref:Uncharacterized protein n=1 Tax=Niabella yanshanensis TaxID=577386 RepID=A0ABZ0W8V0_9BACT|nr:hypothetical protein [Niabella yanshanensis]WQD38969.1 hypothetical protein U0035_02265 [Niabella yanshanensis]
MKTLFIKQWILPFGMLIFYSCKNVQHKDANKKSVDSSSVISLPVEDAISEVLYKSELSPGSKVSVGKIFTDTVTFAERDDNGDYFLFYIRKENRLISLVYDDLVERKLDFLRGDTLVIQWKMDSIWIAGDGDRLDFKERLVSAKKIKDGKVAAFRKNYTKPIRYWYAQNTDYTDEFKDYLYLLVEYYIAYSKQPLVLLHLGMPEQTTFVYSIEERDEKGRHYVVLGLSNDQGTHSNIIQWLYLDSETHRLYEYDLVNDRLIPFP